MNRSDFNFLMCVCDFGWFYGCEMWDGGYFWELDLVPDDSIYA